MSNYHLRDKNLSLKAKGLLSFMLSLPENWDYSLNGLVSICKESKDAIRSTLNELKYQKYLQIKPSRGQNGKFEYNYIIYEKPLNLPDRNMNSPNTGFPYTVKPDTDNPTQINTKEQIDKIDKTDFIEINNKSLITELINLGYIESNDSNIVLYDDLFQECLNNEHNFKEILCAIHYIVPRVISRNFIDENGEIIKNKFGYFKSSMEANFEKLKNISNSELYAENNYKSLINEIEK